MSTDDQHLPEINNENIKSILFEDEMRDSYLSYALSVVTGRAVADIRDGLKPVHRRILWSLYCMGCHYNSHTRKSARVTGDVTGKYHPHGGASVYDAMIRLSQDFSMRLTLVHCQGNNGSIDGDRPAADRYTEVRLTYPGELLLQDIDEEVVDFNPNYDGLLKEPDVLPATYPALLINGTTGIAVGMSTNVPPHNPGEVLKAAIALLVNPNITLDEILAIMPGPDFPTSGTLAPKKSLYQAYSTGKGSVYLRGDCEILDDKITIHSIPYQVNKAKLVERIAELIQDKTIEGIADLRDESDRHGIRIVIELKKQACSKTISQKIYNLTQLQVNIPIQISAIYKKRPKQFTLLQVLQIFLEFREEIVIKRTKFRLRKTEEKIHSLSGRALALNALDQVIAIIRSNKNVESARNALCAMEWSAEQLLEISQITQRKIEKLTESQADSILSLKLSQLTKLERDELFAELKDLANQSQEFMLLLTNRQARLNLIKTELETTLKKINSPRKTKIEHFDSDLDEESMIKQEEMVITLSVNGYIKRTCLDLYRTQHRGGKGRANTKSEELVAAMFTAHTLQSILFFSKSGKAYSKKVYALPNTAMTAKGKSLLSLIPDDEISTVLAVPDNAQSSLLFATAQGKVRRNDIADFSKIRCDGKIAIKLDGNDQLISVRSINDTDSVILATKNGKLITFAATEARVMSSRDSSGVKGIELEPGDSVVSAHVISEPTHLLTVSKKGYGKRTHSENYRVSHRGGKGVMTFNISEKTGDVCCVIPVGQEEDVMLITDQGQTIRIPSSQIRETGRNTQGVKLIETHDTVMQVITTKASEPEQEE